MNENPYASGSIVVEADVTPPNNRPHTFAVGMTLLVLSIGWAFAFMFAVSFFVSGAMRTEDPLLLPRSTYVALGIMFIYNVVLAVGAVGILRRCSYRVAQLVFCMALVPLFGPFYVLGIAVGIWGLLVLRKPGAKASFSLPVQ